MNVHRAILLLLFALLALPCQAADFRAGQVEGLLDLTLSAKIWAVMYCSVVGVSVVRFR